MLIKQENNEGTISDVIELKKGLYNTLKGGELGRIRAYLRAKIWSNLSKISLNDEDYQDLRPIELSDDNKIELSAAVQTLYRLGFVHTLSCLRDEAGYEDINSLITDAVNAVERRNKEIAAQREIADREAEMDLYSYENNVYNLSTTNNNDTNNNNNSMAAESKAQQSVHEVNEVSVQPEKINQMANIHVSLPIATSEAENTEEMSHTEDIDEEKRAGENATSPVGTNSFDDSSIEESNPQNDKLENYDLHKENKAQLQIEVPQQHDEEDAKTPLSLNAVSPLTTIDQFEDKIDDATTANANNNNKISNGIVANGKINEDEDKSQSIDFENIHDLGNIAELDSFDVDDQHDDYNGDKVNKEAKEENNNDDANANFGPNYFAGATDEKPNPIVSAVKKEASDNNNLDLDDMDELQNIDSLNDIEFESDLADLIDKDGEVKEKKAEIDNKEEEEHIGFDSCGNDSAEPKKKGTENVDHLIDNNEFNEFDDLDVFGNIKELDISDELGQRAKEQEAMKNGNNMDNDKDDADPDLKDLYDMYDEHLTMSANDIMATSRQAENNNSKKDISSLSPSQENGSSKNVGEPEKKVSSEKSKTTEKMMNDDDIFNIDNLDGSLDNFFTIEDTHETSNNKNNKQENKKQADNNDFDFDFDNLEDLDLDNDMLGNNKTQKDNYNEKKNQKKNIDEIDDWYDNTDAYDKMYSQSSGKSSGNNGKDDEEGKTDLDNLLNTNPESFEDIDTLMKDSQERAPKNGNGIGDRDLYGTGSLDFEGGDKLFDENGLYEDNDLGDLPRADYPDFADIDFDV